MKHLRIFALVAVAATVLSSFAASGIASATNLYKYTTPSSNDKLLIGTELAGTLLSGSSSLLKDTLGGANETCTSSEFKMNIEKDTTSVPPSQPQGKATIFVFGGCSHTKTTLSGGVLEFKNIAGTTNATVVSKEARFTVKSTIFGISCIWNTGAGTTIGTLTGAKSPTAKAKIDINGVITLENGCGDSTWTGSYEVTSPLGLTVES